MEKDLEGKEVKVSLVAINNTRGPKTTALQLTAVYAEDLVVNDDTQGEEVKHIGKIMPDVRVSIFP
jgi:hypothetical protein